MSTQVQIIHHRCCGVDIHKKILEACILTDDKTLRRRFGTTTKQIQSFILWLRENQVEVVAMESTGVYWKPVYNLLEAQAIGCLIVNAKHIKNVPGRKTDTRDAEWIAQLLRHGLFNASYIPDKEQRELRELARLRTAKIASRTREIQRIQKILEGANIKLSSVVSDINGVTSRQILRMIIEGITDPAMLTKIAGNRLRADLSDIADSLDGIIGDHQRRLLAMQLKSIDFLNEQIAELDAVLEEFEKANENFKKALELLDTIPGVGKRIAQVIAIEAGILMDRFPTAKHLAAWSGMCPGNNESAGKRKSGRTRQGNPHLRSHLVQAAHVVARLKDTFLGAQYHRIAARRGKKRAAVAVGHSIIIIAYELLKNQVPYQELGAAFVHLKNRDRVIRKHLAALKQFGINVDILDLPA